MFVYIIVNNITDKVYIGKTVTRSLQKYLREKLHDARTDQYQGRSHLFAAMKKYTHPEAWVISPLISSLKTNEELCFWERVLIAEYDSQNPEIGYNICRGGEGYSGTKSEDSRKKNSENSLATWQDPVIRARRVENQKKIRDARGGSFLSDNSIVKITTARASQDETNRLEAFNKWKQTVDPDHFKKIGASASREDKQRAGRMGSKEDKQLAGIKGAANGGPKARHVRWHVNRGMISPECSLCQ
jgi:hypothetical protein